MADRKYGQRGYREYQKEARSQPASPAELRRPTVLPTRTVVRCADCGTQLPPLSETMDQCPTCKVALHACQQCTHFAPGRRFECTQPIPERIADKRARNDCSFFSPRVTVERETSSATNDADAARRALHDLFKK